MAINKKQSALWVKATIIFVVLAFVVTALPAIFLGGQPGQTSTATETGAILERIAGEHLPAINSYTAMLESDPASYTVLAATGDTYFDWAFQIRTELGPSNPGQDLPMWNSAIAYYERALDLEGEDPNVRTDLAIAYFYSGQGLRAIDTIEGVIDDDPEFAPAYFNAGIFYRAFDRPDDAIAAFERHIELAPDAQTATTARTWLDELIAQGGAVEATPTP